ncbi:MAG: rhomboid family intramembrane serine protease [Bacteroidota bacterium]|nr:rhomboid family intramembrane serine protease [Bacteroidota bacterium]
MSEFQVWYLSLSRVTRGLLVVYGAAFLAGFAVLWRIPLTAELLDSQFVLSMLWWQKPWQLATYSLIHPASFGGLIHLAFGLFWLYWIGRDLEDLRGPGLMLSLWGFVVVVGGLLAALAAPVLGLEMFVFTGIWAGVIGVMVAVCLWFPDRRIRLFLVGSVRLWYVVAALVVLELLRPASGLVSVGGAAGAWLFVWLDQRGADLHTWADRLLGSSGRPRALRHAEERRPTAAPDTHLDEVDRILDKINAEGMDALTGAERKVLEDASRQ